MLIVGKNNLKLAFRADSNEGYWISKLHVGSRIRLKKKRQISDSAGLQNFYNPLPFLDHSFFSFIIQESFESCFNFYILCCTTVASMCINVLTLVLWVFHTS